MNPSTPSHALLRPVGLSRTSTPMPPGILKNGDGGGRLPPTHPKRQRSASFKNMLVDECDENRTVVTVPDNVSDTASEASSNGSYNNNQPPLLDFMGTMCVASAWFTSCFPCAVVDINDTDDRVVHNLSRESAMNYMYSNNNSDRSLSKQCIVTPESAPISERKHVVNEEIVASNQEKNSKRLVPTQQLPVRVKSDPKLISCIPSVIEEDESSDDEMMMDVASSECFQSKRDAVTDEEPRPHSSFISQQHPHASTDSCHESLSYSQQPRKKMMFGVKNPFGRMRITKNSSHR